jgi:predicted enzyme related to lactoylglutathione lyase
MEVIARAVQNVARSSVDDEAPTRGKLAMSNADARGKFVWHELMTTDPDAAGDFYSNVVPWTTQPSGMPSYSLWMSGKYQAGGLMALPEDAASGTPPHWIVYIGTPDVDSTVQAAQDLGGKVLKEPADIPNVGRFAVLSDPQGAAFAAFTPAPMPGSNPPPGGAVGDFTWHELATTDLESALNFYSELFGWDKGETHDMGPQGIYQIIAHGGQQVGGIYKVPDASTPPNWLSYARVSDVSKAAAAVKAAGGKVLIGPMEVPGGSWILQLRDPQGGAFAVVEEKGAAAKPAKSAKPPKTAAPAKAPPQPKAGVAPTTRSPGGGKVVKRKKSATAKSTAAKRPAAKKSGGRKAPAKKAPAKKAVLKGAARKGAAGKTAGRKAAGKKAAGKKSVVAKRGAAVKRGSKATKRPATRGKSKRR